MSVPADQILAASRNLTVTCDEGSIRWGYHSAVVLRAVTLTREKGVWTLTGTVVSQDEYRVSQRPLVFITTNGWRWPIESLQIADGTCSASLGPKG